MYLIDTNVISEARKQDRADPGVNGFFRDAAKSKAALFLSVLTVGELRRGVELVRRRGDAPQARLLERWLQGVLAASSSRFSASMPTPRRCGAGCAYRTLPMSWTC